MSKAPDLPIPTCPHCSADLATVGYYNWRAAGWIILCVYCPHSTCRKTLTMQVLPDIEAAQLQPPRKSPLES